MIQMGSDEMKAWVAILGAMSGLLLASCGGGEPKGQVAAKVEKDEITVLEIQNELGGFRAPDANTRKLAEQQALNAIVQRKILAEAARKEKIDKSPEYAQQRERLEEVLLVRTWQERLAKAVPAPSPDEVQTFVAGHPDLYSARKRIVIEGIRFAPPRDRAVMEALRPLNTLEEVSAALTARQIPFQNGAGEIDALAVDPRLVEQILKLKEGEVFVLPQGNTVLAGRVRELKVDPVPNNIAVRHATQYLKATRTQEALQRRFSSVVAAGMKEVEYNDAFKPAAKSAAAPAKKAAAAAPATKPAQ
jgi:peptidyl-prolyl cis-trans isomerase C